MEQDVNLYQAVGLFVDNVRHKLRGGWLRGSRWRHARCDTHRAESEENASQAQHRNVASGGGQGAGGVQWLGPLAFHERVRSIAWVEGFFVGDRPAAVLDVAQRKFKRVHCNYDPRSTENCRDIICHTVSGHCRGVIANRKQCVCLHKTGMRGVFIARLAGPFFGKAMRSRVGPLKFRVYQQCIVHEDRQSFVLAPCEGFITYFLLSNCYPLQPHTAPPALRRCASVQGIRDQLIDILASFAASQPTIV
jgi:hypothetical protein